jgi:acyl carrier protein
MSAPPVPSTFCRVAECLLHYAAAFVTPIGPESDLHRDLGLDSLDLYALLFHLENEFSINIPDEEVTHLESVQDVCDMVDRYVAETAETKETP